MDPSLCFIGPAVITAAQNLHVWVSLDNKMTFFYPTHPTQPIEDGRKLITFEPPGEWLTGERLHQWMGARYTPDGTGTDLDRIDRQKIFLKSVLEQQFNFIELIEYSEDFSVSGASAIDDIRKVRLHGDSRRLGRSRTLQ